MTHINPIDTRGMLKLDKIPASNLEYKSELIELSKEAQSFLESQSWCKQIADAWLDWGWGYILGIFLFHIKAFTSDAPEYIWVIVGDIPPACFNAGYYKDRKQAIDQYLLEMQSWIDQINEGKQPDISTIRVNVPPSKDWALKLQERLIFIREKIT